MTPEEFTSNQAVIAERDNEIAALSKHEMECCEQVRVFADARRQAASKRKAVEVATQPLRDAMAAYVQEQRRLHAEKAKAEAESKAKSAAEARAKAAEEAAKQPTPADLMAEIASLKEQLAAKA